MSKSTLRFKKTRDTKLVWKGSLAGVETEIREHPSGLGSIIWQNNGAGWIQRGRTSMLEDKLARLAS